jgi:hypothetical protein
MTRVTMVAAGLLLMGLVTVFAIGVRGALTPILTVVALVVLIGGGNLLYGKNSHGAAAQARIRPAQEARNRAIDEARHRAAEQPDAARPTAQAPDPPGDAPAQ